MPRTRPLTALAALLPLLAACSYSCTSVGCISVVTVNLAGLLPAASTTAGSTSAARAAAPVTATVCLDDACTTKQVDLAANPVLEIPVSDAVGARAVDRPLVVRLTAVGPGGARLADTSLSTTLDRTAPNGEHCGPVCYAAGLALFSGRLVRILPK